MSRNSAAPWEVRESALDGKFQIVGKGPMDAPVIVAKAGYRPIAHLIAAAPELLEALRRAETKLRAYVGVCKDDKELTDTILPMVARAIAKAEGL